MTRRSRRSRLEYWFDKAITFKILKEFPDAVFLGVEVESLLSEVEVSSLHTRVPVRMAITFDLIVGSPSNFHRSFRTLFSLE